MAQYAAPERMFNDTNQLVAYSYGQDAVAASQTDADLYRSMSEASQTVKISVAPWAGDVAGIGYTLSAAATAGSLTIGITKNGTEVAATTQTVATAAKGYAAFARGAVPVAAGDTIGVQITTDGDWDATTADLVVDAYVLYQVTGV